MSSLDAATRTDPGAPGLQITSDGRPKVIDVIEASGSGDVATTTVRRATTTSDGSRQIVGLTGRTLTLNTEWNNPSGGVCLHIVVQALYRCRHHVFRRRSGK